VLAHPSPRRRGVCIAPSPRRRHRRIRLCVRVRAHLVAAECPEPLCPGRALPAPGRPRKPPGEALPPRRRSYGLMRQTIPLPAPPVHPWPLGLCRLSPVPAARWPFPTLSLRSLRGCSDPYPAALPGCTYPLLHRGHRSHPNLDGFDARISPHMAASVGASLSRLQSFDHLRAPALARPPGCSHRSGVNRQAARPFTPRIAQPVTRTGMWRCYMLDTDD
jgi:hypothetical protein